LQLKSAHDFTSSDEATEGILEKNVKLAVDGGIKEVHRKDVQKVLNYHMEKLTKNSFNSTRMKILNLTTQTLQQ
jgi:hypothetical protein